MARTTLGSGRMIEQTSVQITAQRERWQAERELRYARRNRIRHIDLLLDRLEMLNICQETQRPADLAFRWQRLAAEMEHPLGNRAPEDISIGESMDALYDLQDGLMLTLDGVQDDEEVSARPADDAGLVVLAALLVVVLLAAARASLASRPLRLAFGAFLGGNRDRGVAGVGQRGGQPILRDRPALDLREERAGTIGVRAPEGDEVAPARQVALRRRLLRPVVLEQ